MNRFGEMLHRANLQNVSYLFQIGSMPEILDKNNLEAREEEAVKRLKKELGKNVPESSYQQVIDTAMEYANSCCEIYFTVGMKAGTKLMFQLLNDSLKDY